MVTTVLQKLVLDLMTPARGNEREISDEARLPRDPGITNMQKMEFLKIPKDKNLLRGSFGSL